MSAIANISGRASVGSPLDEGDPSAGFFAIDLRIWRRVVDQGLNQSVAFLVLARGSGGDNATTSWSTDAIERYTGISRPRAKAAIADLEAAGVCDLIRGGTKPQRRIRRASEVPGCPGCRQALTPAEASLLARLPIQACEQDPGQEILDIWEYGPADPDNLTPIEEEAERLLEAPPQYTMSDEERALAKALVQKGHARWDNEPYHERWLKAVPIDEPDHDWIWLPNGIIDGVAGEPSPVELIRQTRSVGLLRVFIEAYHSHLLALHGGLDPWMHGGSEGKIHGTHWGYNIWIFPAPTGIHIRIPLRCPFTIPAPPWDDNDEWHGSLDTVMRAMPALLDMGLIEMVPMLYEGPDHEAEIIHPLVAVTTTTASKAEGNLAQAAREAAHRLDPTLDRYDLTNWLAVPLPRHLKEPEVRGIMRLRYRPRTTETARWLAQSEEWESTARKFQHLGLPLAA